MADDAPQNTRDLVPMSQSGSFDGSSQMDALPRVEEGFKCKTGEHGSIGLLHSARIPNPTMFKDGNILKSTLQTKDTQSSMVNLENEFPPVGSQLESYPLLKPNRDYCITSTVSCSLPDTKADLQCSSINLDLDDDKTKDESAEPCPPFAIWVKWRGKWQTGIYCSNIDCPIQTLRARPTHGRKQYLSIFFPLTRTYGWVDRQLVHSIDEVPGPLAYSGSDSWLELVRDLSFPKRFAMQKLAISMLDISDTLHTEAVTQSARVASFWKDFAKEASCCENYLDLGRLLLKLQKVILPRYINSEWLNISLSLWIQKCGSAESAESIEMLTKELADSVLWNEVNELWNAPIQPELGSEWKTWKREAMKWLVSSLPSFNSDLETLENSATYDSQRSAKRPKLEIRRPNMHEDAPGDLETKMNAEADVRNTGDLVSEYVSPSTCQPYPILQMIGMPEVKKNSDHCNNTRTKLSRGDNCGIEVLAQSIEPPLKNKYRRCLTFMEAKGKQCGRWASDGSDYCFAHSGVASMKRMLSNERLPKEVMCMGITTHGNKCKHQAKFGSSFCKKHQYSKFIVSERGSIYNSASVYQEKENLNSDVQVDASHSTGGSDTRILPIQGAQSASQDDLVQVMVGESFKEGNLLMKRHALYSVLPAPVSVDIMRCIGSKSIFHNVQDECQENATQYNLYCEKHLPKFLKLGKTGKTGFISEEIFVDLLKGCSSRRDKVHLHQACKIFHRYMKKTFSSNMVSVRDHLNWILSEASKFPHVGDYLLKLVSIERKNFCGSQGPECNESSVQSFQPKSVATSVSHAGFLFNDSDLMFLKCKACDKEFHDDQSLGIHWLSIHRKEAKHLFRGYACAICMDSFTGKKILESHINDKHGMQFLKHSVLFRCMSCNSHFPNPANLWEHVLSFHSEDLRVSVQLQDQLHSMPAEPKAVNELGPQCNGDKNETGSQYFFCELCTMQFNFISDLEYHHRAVHMNPATICFSSKRDKQHLLTNKRHPSRHKIGLKHAFRRKNGTNLCKKKPFQASSSVIVARLRRQAKASETLRLGKLGESECSSIAERLFAVIRQTRPQPSNSEIILLARSACCAEYIYNDLRRRYGTSSWSIYLRAAKLCSELNIPISWHMDDFVCPRGCRVFRTPSLAGLAPISNDFSGPSTSLAFVDKDGNEMHGCHLISSPRHLSRHDLLVLCEDISFGKEHVPVACVIDNDTTHLVEGNCIEACQYLNKDCMPWQGFSYVTQRFIDPSLCLDAKSSQMGCACQKNCHSLDCDHVYLLVDDYKNAEDVNGFSMHGKFSYDENGRIILKEGYPIYECNSLCACDRTCQNRVLQNGMRVRLEIFKTEKKGWAVRALEAIARGTFICEYIGEVISAAEAHGRAQRYTNSIRRFHFDISALACDLGQLNETQVPYVIDATNYGNVSRFINHSCSPNLSCYLVVVDSMECQLAHVGIFARQDISKGEELVFNYRPSASCGDECPCYCGSSNCRGFL